MFLSSKGDQADGCGLWKTGKANPRALSFRTLRKACQCADPLDLSYAKATADVRSEEIHTVQFMIYVMSYRGIPELNLKTKKPRGFKKNKCTNKIAF